MVFVLLRAWQPPVGPEYAVCMSRRLLQLPCPICGLTRAFTAIAQGELRAALTFHPLAPIVLVEVIAIWVVAFFRIRGCRRVRIPPRIIVANLAAFLIVWVGRLATGTLPR